MTNDEQQPQQQQRWFPLESNPTLINWYITKMGYDTTTTNSSYEFVDVFSTEDWALEMVDQPVAAVMLLYPLTKAQLQNTPDDEQASSEVLTTSTNEDDDQDVWFMKQRIGNACGTIALIHTLANLPDDVAKAGGLSLSLSDMETETEAESFSGSSSEPTSWLHRFLKDTKGLDPIQRAERLESDADIAKMHDTATSSLVNATGRGEIDDDVETHFIALVEVGGTLYELDGRKGRPIPHGPTTRENLLKDACQKVVRDKFMARDPTEVRFAITALSPKKK